MNTQRALFFLAAVATHVLGCSFAPCDPQCRRGSRLVEQKIDSFPCKREGEEIDFKAAFPFLNSCEGVEVVGEGCSVVKNGAGATATCEGRGVCKVEWRKLTPTCICERSGPCDGKCTAVPQCADNEELSTRDCAIVEGECRVVEKCCVEAHCVPKKTCTLECGVVVKNGWSGLGFGTNYCNTCNCVNGNVGCTKILCPPQTPTCLRRGSICRGRARECPVGTKCSKFFGRRCL